MIEKALQTYLSKAPFDRFDLNAVLFDMDGVLFDSMPRHAYAWCTTLHELGLAFTEEECYLHEGRTGSGTINIVFQRTYGRDATEKEVQRIYARKTALFESQSEAPVMPGALKLLNQVKAAGLQRVLVTGSGQEALLTRLNRHFPGQFDMDKMVTAYDGKRGKPDPEPFLMGLKKAGATPRQAIVVENAPLGIQAAKAAGIFTIAVNTGLLKDSHLWDAGADLVIHGGMQALSEKWPTLLEALTTVTASDQH
jgi:HAD superfamily hydrolase (TIGR01509 family)